MTDLKQQLEAVGDRMANDSFNQEDFDKIDAEIRILYYKAGFNAAIPIIVELAEALKNAGKDFNDIRTWLHIEHGVITTQFSRCIKDTDKALSSLKKFVEVTNENK